MFKVYKFSEYKSTIWIKFMKGKGEVNIESQTFI